MQDACVKCFFLTGQCPIDRDPAPASPDDEDRRPAFRGRKLYGSEFRKVASAGHSVERADVGFRQDLIRPSCPVDLPVRYTEDKVGKLLREVDLVQGHEDGDVFCADKIFEDGQEFQLMADIEKGGGLVQDQDFRVLTDRPGEQDPLALAVADLCEIPVSEIGDLREGHGLLYDFPIPGTCDPEPPRVGITAESDDFAAGHELRILPLRGHDGKRFCGLSRLQCGEIFIFQEHRSPQRGETSGNCSEEGRFSCPVRSDQGEDLPRGQIDVHIFKNERPAVPGIQAVCA